MASDRVKLIALCNALVAKSTRIFCNVKDTRGNPDITKTEMIAIVIRSSGKVTPFFFVVDIMMRYVVQPNL